MKLAKRVFLEIALTGVTATSVVQAQGYVTESSFPNFFAEMRPMIAKMAAADKKMAMSMEAGIMKMERDHQMAMIKSAAEHKMAMLKMRREYEDFLQGRGGSQ